MSKHNNNLAPSSHARCHCGRHATIGEWKATYANGGMLDGMPLGGQQKLTSPTGEVYYDVTC